MKLHTKILLGLLIGAVLGILAKLTLGSDHSLVTGINEYVAGPAGQIFLRLLFMVVVPLVFASITVGVAGLGDIRRVGRVGGKAMGIFFLTTVASASVGLLGVHLIRPGTRIDPATRTQLLQEYSTQAGATMSVSATQDFGVNTLVNLFTRNPVRSAADLDLLGVIVFAIIFGAALTLIQADRARALVTVLEAVNDVVIKIVEFAMKLAPYGVAALIFGMTSTFGFELLVPLMNYILLVLGALLFHALVTNTLIIRFIVGMSPWTFYNRIRTAIVTAFSTSSSSATLPTNMAVAERNLGIPKSVAGFVMPLGATMNMNGTSLFEGITVIFLAQVFGVGLNLGQQVVVVIMCVLTAIGAAGVPGGSIPLLVGILAMFGVPAEGIAIILGVDRILDMSRTTLNIAGDAVATAWVAKSERVWSPADLPPGSATLEATSGHDATPENRPISSA